MSHLGVYPETNTLYVQCLCGSKAQQHSNFDSNVQQRQGSAAPASAPVPAATGCSSTAAPQLWGLEEWVEIHTGGPAIPAELENKDEAEAIIKQLPASLQGWDTPVSTGSQQRLQSNPQAAAYSATDADYLLCTLDSILENETLTFSQAYWAS